MNEQIPSMDVKSLSRQLSSEEASLVLLDVREAFERKLAMIKDSTWIPMKMVPQRLEELPEDRKIAVVCHHGSRSGRVVVYLRQHGFDAVNVRGGIDAWTLEVDPEVPRY